MVCAAAILAIAAGELVPFPLLIAGALMIFDVWLHLTERHEHRHAHDSGEYAHESLNDEHHQLLDSFFMPPALSIVVAARNDKRPDPQY